MVNIQCCASQSEIERTQNTNVFIVFLLNEFINDLLRRLNLQHFEDQTNEWRRFPESAISSADVLQLHSFIDQQLGSQRKTMLFPIQRVIDLAPSDLLDDELRVCSMD